MTNFESLEAVHTSNLIKKSNINIGMRLCILVYSKMHGFLLSKKIII